MQLMERKMQINARNVALEALRQVGENEGYSNIVLDKTLRKYDMDKRDRALCSTLFYGVLEKRITLDFYISKFLKNPNWEVNEQVREILRLAVYQIMYLDKIPDNAIVNEAVDAAKAIKKQNFTGFVNAVLRELLRNKDNISLPTSNSLKDLSIRYSVPEDLIDMWCEAYSKEVCIKILESLSERAKTYIRVNSTKTDRKSFIESFTGSEIMPTPYYGLDNACSIVNPGSLTSLEQFKDGLFHVQDLSSQYLCKLIDPKPHEIIIDCCAAPGGKTFTMAEKMENTGRVYAYDLYKGRVKLIREGAYRLGLKNVLGSMRDATTDKECEVDNVDIILCDVPCSGFGTIRRKPEIRYKDIESIKELPKIQFDILKKSSKLLKKGGLLVYSTCTLNPLENDEVVERFLDECKGFEPVSIPRLDDLDRVIEEPSYQQTLMPFALDIDGFFVAMFRKL